MFLFQFDNNFVAILFLQITVGRVLKALVTLRGLVIEWVIVKAFNEEMHLDNGKVRHAVFCCCLNIVWR